jgi:endonuclease/exonuclease/phosphatase family metal-dependent hydrolase
MWANNLQTPTYEKLDIILVSTDWELKFARVTVQSLPRGISDHTPYCWTLDHHHNQINARSNFN